MHSVLCCCLILLLGKTLADRSCPGDAGGGPIRTSGVTAQDIQVILDAHNQHRDQVAAGAVQASGGLLPSASNMKKMVWDNDLASAAQNHADQCKFKHFSPNAGRYGTGYGQNLFMSMSSGSMGPADWNSAVNSWFNEVNKFPVNNRLPFKFTEDTGHFSQVVWAESDRVGCGYTQYKATSDQTYPEHAEYTCNYYKQGNVVGIGVVTTMYEAGNPCSSCQCDATYKHLCK